MTKPKRVALNGLIKYDGGLSRFELIFEDGAFYALYLGDNLHDGINTMAEFFSEFGDEYWNDLDAFRDGEYGMVSDWMEQQL